MFMFVVLPCFYLGLTFPCIYICMIYTNHLLLQREMVGRSFLKVSLSPSAGLYGTV